jgi:hypothetical protein
MDVERFSEMLWQIYAKLHGVTHQNAWFFIVSLCFWHTDVPGHFCRDVASNGGAVVRVACRLDVGVRVT